MKDGHAGCTSPIVCVCTMQLSEEEAESGKSATGESSVAPGGGRDRGAALEDAVLQNSHHFHQWHSELEAARTSETEEKYRRYAATLEGHLRGCQQILDKARISPNAEMPLRLLLWTEVYWKLLDDLNDKGAAEVSHW